MIKDEAYLTIGATAKASGLSRKALMLLEREGVLIPKRGSNGYRFYSEQQLRWAGIVQRLKAAGLSAAAIRDVMAKKSKAATRSGKLAATAAALERAKAQLLEKRRAIDEAVARLESLIEECRMESSINDGLSQRKNK